MNTMDVFNNYSKESNYELSKALVAEFEKVACVKFEDKMTLKKHYIITLIHQCIGSNMVFR